MGNSEYVHPESGRTYREGDPAHRFAQLLHGLARQCERFSDYVTPQLDRDYLEQHRAWPGDLDNIARAMRETLAAIDKAYTEVTYDRTMHEFGLGVQDDEWHRKYGEVSEEN